LQIRNLTLPIPGREEKREYLLGLAGLPTEIPIIDTTIYHLASKPLW
jgi:hypothetical protein